MIKLDISDLYFIKCKLYMKRQGFKWSVFLFFFLLATNTAQAQDERFKAIFIYNFTKYINWPAKQGNFIICVLGNDDILPEIQSIASKKMVGTATIEVIKVNSTSEIQNCNIIYVPQNKSEYLPRLFKRQKMRNFLS